MNVEHLLLSFEIKRLFYIRYVKECARIVFLSRVLREEYFCSREKFSP